MQSYGIYTLANDVVYDQLVALLNSIEANVSPDIPICVIPFDDRLNRVKQEIKTRPNVTLFDDWQAIQRWETFAQEVWSIHPAASTLARPAWGKGHHRKFVAFDGPFEKFVFYDADSLAMKPVQSVFERLDTYDFVFDDWEHKKSHQNAALNIQLIEQATVSTEAQLRPLLHCSSFFGSKRGIFSEPELATLKTHLIADREVNWIPRWWDDAFLFTYLTFRCDRPLFNFTLSPNGQERTGNCANADPFVTVDHVLYNQQGMKPIHRIHYMGYSANNFTRLSHGEAADIPFREVFLHYRFLKHPEQKPQTLKSAGWLLQTNRLVKKAAKKLEKLSLAYLSS